MFWPLLASVGTRLGGGLLQQLFGGQEAGYQMSPSEKKLEGELWGQYKGGIPGHITAPFARHAKNIKQSFARRPGSSAKEHSIIQRQAWTPMAEAGGRYKKSLLSTIMALTKGTGTQTASSGAPWGDIMGGAGEDFGFLWGLRQMLKGRGQGVAV